MTRRALLPLLFALALLPIGAVPAAPVLAEAVGTVTSFNRQISTLNVNTRLGPKSFLLNSSTLVLLNNHSAAASDITAGDKVTVRYHFDTSIADTVHLFRQQRREGKITAATANSVDLKIDGAAVSFRTDTNSRVELEQIPVGTRSVLAGRRATVLFEPGTNLLLSLAADARRARGPITAIGAAAKTVTIGGKQPRTFTLDAAATVLRNGATATITSLVTGDTVTIAFVKSGATLSALALSARAQPAPAP